MIILVELEKATVTSVQVLGIVGTHPTDEFSLPRLVLLFGAQTGVNHFGTTLVKRIHKGTHDLQFMEPRNFEESLVYVNPQILNP